jgi:hypothetical protein
MKARLLTVFGLRLGALLLFSSLSCYAAASLSQQIDSSDASVGDHISLTLKIDNGSFKQKSGASFFGMVMPGSPEIALPPVDGIQAALTSYQTVSMNGAASATAVITLIPTRAGDYTIPAFDINAEDGSVLHTNEIKLHVSAAATPPPNAQPIPSPTQSPPAMQNFNPNGPVVYPPTNNAASQSPVAPTETGNGNLTIPTEAGGRPAKVFMAIKPQTTDAYVGQSIPMKIEFYIRLDSAAQQDSLPTIKGSDFLMNSLSVRFAQDQVGLLNEGFERDSWFTAISAPKPGDFPLQMERDTYWRKSSPNSDPYTNFFPSRENLAHEPVPSNATVIHVHELPTEGRPTNFSGAIGQFTVTGGAQPLTVAVGEPVTLHFTVSGQGNFDYVRCPTLADDPAWKAYVPSSKVAYQDESHVQGSKSFEMAIIPKKGGTLPLTQASFSYFDPNTKKYVTVPVDLPPITVTGSAPAAVTPTGTTADASTVAVASGTDSLRPNRIDPGSLRSSFKPLYWQPWFWAVQGGLLCLVVLAGLFLFLRSRKKPDTGLSERLARQQALDHEVDAMSNAVTNKDALAFFLAARHAIQLQLSNEWKVKPETLTLAEIRLRDPELAQSLEPLFVQTDEVVYSGGTAKGIDLPQWGRHVSELLQSKGHTVTS